MLKKTALFLLAVLIQMLIVAAVPAKQIYTRLTGRLITIKTAIIDPYNILSGYYVILNYEISTSPLFDQINYPSKGKPSWVYVLLKEGPNGVWVVDSAYKQKPDNIPQDKVLIKGESQYHRIEYSVENYYIPEEKRSTIERDLRNNRDKTYAQIKVDRFGNAALESLRIGETTYEY
jgi:uncharacterized membrane-anchored protein